MVDNIYGIGGGFWDRFDDQAQREMNEATAMFRDGRDLDAKAYRYLMDTIRTKHANRRKPFGFALLLQGVDEMHWDDPFGRWSRYPTVDEAFAAARAWHKLNPGHVVGWGKKYKVLGFVVRNLVTGDIVPDPAVNQSATSR